MAGKIIKIIHMKLKIFKKSNFSTTLFVAASLIVFLALSMIYLVQKISLDFIQINDYANNIYKGSGNEDEYYFKKSKTIHDPFITMNPDFDKILSGPIISPNDPSMGDREAQVVIVYYSDFSCDYCQKQEQVLKEIVAKYKYQVKLIWKDYPENDKNSKSYRSAVAARCAQAQDSFWAYHDFLYEFSDRLSEDTYLEIADTLKLDNENFKKCMNSENPQKLINNNIEEADALDIIGIPFMYINDQEILGEIDFETLDEMVQHKLDK